MSEQGAWTINESGEREFVAYSPAFIRKHSGTRTVTREEAQAAADKLTSHGWFNFAEMFTKALAESDAPEVEVTMAKWAWKDVDRFLTKGYMIASRGARMTHAWGFTPEQTS